MRRPAAALPAGLTLTAGTAALWPGFAVLLAGLMCIVWATARDPRQGLWIALALFSFEGLAKLSLTAWGAPVDADPRAIGALLVDTGLAIPVVALLVADRGSTPAQVWARASRWERAAFAALGLWLALSVVQMVVPTGSLGDGLQGFRLTQAYVVLALAGLILFRDAQPPLRPLLGLTGLVCGYAVLRVLTGPLEIERFFVLQRDPAAIFGENTFRAVGSFQSAVALASFITPAVVWAAVLAAGDARLRRPAIAVTVLAAVAVLASFVRVSLVAIPLALGLALLLGRGPGHRARGALRTVATGLALLAVVLGLGLLASRGVPYAEERFEGLLNPGDDSSLDIRFNTWERALENVAAQPLGQGLGTVGHAATDERGGRAVTDNSLLKILVEQGIEGALLYMAGLLGICVACAVRLRRAPPSRRLPGVAALCGFVAFALLGMAGEYVEQPGKALAWLLLGAAVGLAFLATRGDGSAPPVRARPGAGPPWPAVAWVAPVLAIAAVMLAFTLARDTEFSASVRATPVRGGPVAAPVAIEYWRRLLGKPGLVDATLAQLPARTSSARVEAAVLEPAAGEPGTFLIVAADTTPERAAALALELGEQLDAALVLRIRRVANREAAAIHKALKALPDVPPDSPRLRRLGERLERLFPARFEPLPPRLGLSSPRQAEPEAWADSMVDALPGPFPPRPSPLWVILAGALAAGLALGLRPRLSREGAAT